MLSEERLEVGELMARANRRLKQDVTTGMFVALLYGELSARDRVLTLCSAGQTQPVHVSAATGEARLVETAGDTFPLGILDEAEYEGTRLELGPGDTVILYTDGIVEAMNESSEIFGFERLLELARVQAPGATAEGLLQAVDQGVRDFVGKAQQHDDMTVIVVRAGGAPATATFSGEKPS
jgi:sigma-B regulation protein RsbU (phosphoserine phosphatase)